MAWGVEGRRDKPDGLEWGVWLRTGWLGVGQLVSNWLGKRINRLTIGWEGVNCVELVG